MQIAQVNRNNLFWYITDSNDTLPAPPPTTRKPVIADERKLSEWLEHSKNNKKLFKESYILAYTTAHAYMNTSKHTHGNHLSNTSELYPRTRHL